MADHSDEDADADDMALELFTHNLDMDGIAVASVEDGLVLGVSKQKLAELLKIAEEHEDGRVIIFVNQTGDSADLLN